MAAQQLPAAAPLKPGPERNVRDSPEASRHPPTPHCSSRRVTENAAHPTLALARLPTKQISAGLVQPIPGRDPNLSLAPSHPTAGERDLTPPPPSRAWQEKLQSWSCRNQEEQEPGQGQSLSSYKAPGVNQPPRALLGQGGSWHQARAFAVM